MPMRARTAFGFSISSAFQNLRTRHPWPAHEAIPPAVRHAFGVLATIQLDNEPMSRAREVSDKGADRKLPPELHAAEAAVAEEAPKALFDLRRFATQRAGLLEVLAFAHVPPTLTPTLSRKRQGYCR